MSKDKNHGRDNSLSNDEELCRQHEDYMKKVTESGMPLWMADMYKEMLTYNQPKPINHEPDSKNNITDDSEPDPHMFI